jgi:hypothetical protein
VQFQRVQQDEDQWDVIDHNQNNVQSEMGSAFPLVELRDVAQGELLPLVVLYLPLLSWLHFTLSIFRYGIAMSERLIKFREVVRPPLWLMAFIYFLALSLGIAIWATMTTMIAAVVMALLTAVTFLIYFTSSLVIEVDEHELRVGKAHIEKKFCGEVIVLTPAQMSLQRTREADPAAYLAIRFWTAHGVKIVITDGRDQTPYWLVTSKRGDALTQALRKN